MMLRRSILAALAFAVVVIIGWLAYERFVPPSNTLTLIFHAGVGNQPLERNSFVYDNPGGEGRFRIRNFRFYLSNFELLGAGSDDSIKIADSYHLARFDNADSTYKLEFKDLSLRDLHALSFAIGVDAQANTSIQVRGDLDPNGQMAWNWKVGYKFVLLEGSLKSDAGTLPLVYHVGFSENLRDFRFEWPEPMNLSQENRLAFSVDVMKLFDSTTTVDMAKLSSVKFDKNDASMLANNYRHMIALKPAEQ